jgi:hypothetical protein
MTSQLEALRYAHGVRPAAYQKALKDRLLEGDLSGALEIKQKLVQLLYENGDSNLHWRLRNTCKVVLEKVHDDLVAGLERA